jgi:predicted DsbA family dithiol-disulfide isomerase
MNRLEIDVYSDFVCPWCFIGSRRLETALQSIGETHILMRHRPYLLYPNVPSDGTELRGISVAALRAGSAAAL